MSSNRRQIEDRRVAEFLVEIDRRQAQRRFDAECDCCGQRVPVSEISFISAESSGSAGCDTYACEQCTGDAP